MRKIMIVILMLNVSIVLSASFDAMERAKLFPVVLDKPAVNFFEGALLGNGGLGVVVRTRPDAVVLHFGHNNVWDIRLADENKEKFGTFQEIFDKINALSDSITDLSKNKWYSDYRNMCRENYAKPYPRPFPCGTLVLGFDRRHVELIGHRLDISNGLCKVELLIDNSQKAFLFIFTDMQQDHVWLKLVDEQGALLPNCFDRIRLLPDPSTPGEFPPYSVLKNEIKGQLAFRQILPSQVPEKYNLEKGHPKDRAISLSVSANQSLGQKFYIDARNGEKRFLHDLEGALSAENLILVAQLNEGLASSVPNELLSTPEPTLDNFDKTFALCENTWKKYWDCSGVLLDDPFLEKIWYRNSYFLNCSVKADVTCPGLFANWSYNRIGTAWHGDYHLNYNWQQPFWFTFSSNHLDKNLPYIDTVYNLLPVSRLWAKEYYQMRGAFFPHSAYPVEMTTHPYPCPDWGWEVCETPWAVQGLWWHYLYSQDKSYLKDRLFEPIKDAVLFLIDYMQRPDAFGEKWGDDKYHIYPTVVPELYGYVPLLSGLKHDCIVDLTLTRFVFKAYLEAVKELGIEKKERKNVKDVKEILGSFPDYPTKQTEKHGRVFVSAPAEHPEAVYNVPNSLMPVFPGEHFGLHTSKDTLDILANTFKNFQVEGGNELVFQYMQAVRLGKLDMEKFKRQINYCLLPNGTAADMVLQVHGRYSDRTEFDFMAPMGIWFENFSLPAVINECLLQSYNGTLRFFPNWPKDKDAEFKTLRAVGAFLVSASFKNGTVQWIEINSEAGSELSIVNPWKDGCQVKTAKKQWHTSRKILDFPTEKGEKLRLTPIR